MEIELSSDEIDKLKFMWGVYKELNAEYCHGQGITFAEFTLCTVETMIDQAYQIYQEYVVKEEIKDLTKGDRS
jgi:hypothetical protein